MNVKDIMSSPVHSLRRSQTVRDAAKLMVARNISGVLVTGDDNKPTPVSDLGVVTERDITRKVVLQERFSPEIPLSEIMSKPLITVSTKSSIEEANRLISEHNIRRVFIVEGDSVVGIVTQSDLLRSLRYLTARGLVRPGSW